MADKKPSNRDTILSDYVRHRIREWETSGRELKEIAKIGGIAKSQVSMVKKQTGVGAKTSPGFARAFGFESAEAMVLAAHDWRRGHGEDLERRLADEAFKEGVVAARTWVAPPATDAEVRTIAGDFVGPRFDGREPKWWADTLCEEVKRDRMRTLAATQGEREERRVAAAALQAEEREWRGRARRKHNVEDAAAELRAREAAAEADVEQLRKRRKIRAV